MERLGFRPGIRDADREQEVVRVALGVVRLDDPVAVVVEDAGIEQLVLGSCLPRRRVLGDEVRVRELGLRVVVAPSVPRVAREGVEVPPVLLGILAVVALLAGQAEDALLEDRVAPVPEREAKAEPLLDVGEAPPGRPLPSGRRASGHGREGSSPRRCRPGCSPRARCPTGARSGTAPRGTSRRPGGARPPGVPNVSTRSLSALTGHHSPRAARRRARSSRRVSFSCQSGERLRACAAISSRSWMCCFPTARSFAPPRSSIRTRTRLRLRSALYLDPEWQPAWANDRIDWPDQGCRRTGRRPRLRSSAPSPVRRAARSSRSAAGSASAAPARSWPAWQPSPNSRQTSAVPWVRKHYRAASVETPDQAAWVRWFASWVHERVPRRQPA